MPVKKKVRSPPRVAVDQSSHILWRSVCILLGGTKYPWPRLCLKKTKKKNREELITSRHLSPEWERGWGRRVFSLKLTANEAESLEGF